MVLKVVVTAFSSPHLQCMEFIEIAFVLPEFTPICGTAREFAVTLTQWQDHGPSID